MEKKITIMLEEIKFKFKITKINIDKDEQFDKNFEKISPFRKIPVIIDHDNKISIFESGAILMYLGEKSGKFYNKEKKIIIDQWLMGQMAYVGQCLVNIINFITTILEKASLVKKDILKFLNVFMKNWIIDLKYLNILHMTNTQLLILRRFLGLQDMSGMTLV